MRYQRGTHIDHFEILKALGEGAYAESYQAVDTDTGLTVVLKSPNPVIFADPAVFARWQREMDIARRLDHPGIVRGLDCDEHRSEPYLILEYVEGEDFRRHLGTYEGSVPVDTARRWGGELASVLVYLQAQGIVHRDLKPENIIITAAGDLKVIDFGTAMLDGAKRLTWRHVSESLGTPDYMSPEQIQGERGDTRSDIYSWGIMMYEFLTGHVPFRGDNWMAVMAGHLTRQPERIRRRNPSVPPALEAVVLKAMRRYPEHRYQDPADLVDDLAHLDTLDPDAFDLSPEPPMGAVAEDASARRWKLIALGALGVIGIVAIILAVAVLQTR